MAARAMLLGWAVVGGPLLWLPFTLPPGGREGNTRGLGPAQVVESGGGLVPRAGLRGRGPKGSLGEGQQPSSVSRGTPQTSTLQHLPAASGEVPPPQLGAQSRADPSPPASLAMPLPVSHPSAAHNARIVSDQSCLCDPGSPHSLGLRSMALSFSTWPIPAPPSTSCPASSPQRHRVRFLLPEELVLPAFSPDLCPNPIKLFMGLGAPQSQGADLLHLQVPSTEWTQTGFSK